VVREANDRVTLVLTDSHHSAFPLLDANRLAQSA
jgi:hypothetical protein